jgi:hypothetical protein
MELFWTQWSGHRACAMLRVPVLLATAVKLEVQT